jgi:4-amino-4-deoxy-L-arabinose transferase-like glycosyltransferase
MVADLAHQALFVAAVWALGAAMLRPASLVAPSGLDRFLVLVTLAVASAVATALLLGLVGLGGSPVALALAALAAWAISHVLPAPEVSLEAEVAAAMHSTPARRWSWIGGLVGAIAGWVAWNVYAPSIAPDGVYYHVPEIARWAQDGNPGAVLSIHPLIPVGAYPLTHDVLLTWPVSISRSLLVVSACGPAFVGLLVLSSWSAVRRVGGSQVMAWLAAGALCTLPLLIGSQPDGSLNDLPGLAWLATATTFALGARERPTLGFAALVAAGLAAGAKTNLVPFAVVAALVAVLAMLRPKSTTLTRQAGLGIVIALGTGGIWYLRNLITHGSPAWPYASAPWGDPPPPAFRTYTSLLQDPLATLHGRVGAYSALASGGILLLLAGLAAGAIGPARTTRLAGAVVPVGVLAWAASPTSGLSTFDLLSAPVSQLRYLLPVMGTAALGLVLLARHRPNTEPAVRVTFAGVIAWNLGQDLFGETAPAFPVRALLGGAIAGAALLWSASRVASLLRRAKSVGLVVGAAALVLLLGVAVQNHDARLAARDRAFDQHLARYMYRQQAFVRGTTEVAMAPELSGTLVGYRLRHRLRLLKLPAPCAELAALRQRWWVIVRDDETNRRLLGYRIPACLRDAPHATVAGGYRIYRPLLTSGR